MLILLVLGFIVVGIIWLMIELFMSPSLNAFLDVKIMRRTVWIWLPIYALWRLSREIIFNTKDK